MYDGRMRTLALLLALSAACVDASSSKLDGGTVNLDGALSGDGALPGDAAPSDDALPTSDALPGDGGSDLATATTDLALGAPPYRPFGSHAQIYPPNVIFPSGSATARDAAVKAAYDDWKARYLAAGCAADRSVVKFSTAADYYTVSEAHGYGMVITVLMAGYDADAQTTFDNLFRYYDAHRSASDLSAYGHATNLFMSWRQTDQCVNSADDSSATDGDVDIAYALLLADRQWGSGGAIDYRTRALGIVAQLMDALIEGTGTAKPRYITIGDGVLADSAWLKRTRSSDFILSEFRSFRAASGDARWDDALAGLLDLAATLQNDHSPLTGLLPDFIESADTSSPAPAAPNTLESAHDGHWYANACRTPWRIGQDAVLAGDAESRAIVEKMTTFMRAETGEDPTQICSGYDLAGNALDACDWHALEYIAPFAVAAMVSSDHQAWLDAIWAIMKDPSLIAAERQYYGDSINLLTMLVVSGNWWQP